MFKSLFALIVLVALSTPTAFAAAPDLDALLQAGKLADAENALLLHLRENPKDDTARAGLGVVQVLRSVELLSQNLYTYGARTRRLGSQIPILRAATPAGENPKPQTLSYFTFRSLVESWQDSLKQAEATLALVKDPNIKLPIHIGLARLDFNGDGKADPAETLWKIYGDFGPTGPVNAQQAQAFFIQFDLADVYWLRGYCHALMATSDLFLAYDHKDLFDSVGHVFFADVETPHKWMAQRRDLMDMGIGADLVDVIAVIHMIRFPVKEPARMESARQHFKQVVALSRQTWDAVLAETDDDHEWIPGPAQHSVIANATVAIEQVKAWRKMLDEVDNLLDGKTLLPFWRSNGTEGINLRKVFDEPTPFDLVMWIQGASATPYLQKGPITDPKVWNDLGRLFGDNLIGFSLWFN